MFMEIVIIETFYHNIKCSIILLNTKDEINQIFKMKSILDKNYIVLYNIYIGKKCNFRVLFQFYSRPT